LLIPPLTGTVIPAWRQRADGGGVALN
jgi:hypothetical protein